MFLLPPCNSVLILDVKQANYLAKMWKTTWMNQLDSDDITENRFLSTGSAYWLDYIFPRDIEEILCVPSFSNNDFDEFDDQDKLSDDTDEGYNDDDDEREY